MNTNILSEDIGASFINGIIGQKLVSCPFCKKNKMHIGVVKFLSKNRTVGINETDVFASNKTPIFPEIIEHHQNFKYEDGRDNATLIKLFCTSSLDCPPITVILHSHKKGISVEFSKPVANPLRIKKNNFIIKEENKGVVLFTNKSDLETVRLVNSKVMQDWMIGQKVVNLDNSNFFAYFVEEVTTVGIPISNWVKVDEKNYFRVFVIRSPDLATEELVVRFKFKDDNGKWVRSKENIPVPPNDELREAWETPGSIDNLVPLIFNIVSNPIQ